MKRNMFYKIEKDGCPTFHLGTITYCVFIQMLHGFMRLWSSIIKRKRFLLLQKTLYFPLMTVCTLSTLTSAL